MNSGSGRYGFFFLAFVLNVLLLTLQWSVEAARPGGTSPLAVEISPMATSGEKMAVLRTRKLSPVVQIVQ